jgi:hypothetical protein
VEGPELARRGNGADTQRLSVCDAKSSSLHGGRSKKEVPLYLHRSKKERLHVVEYVSALKAYF